MIHLRVFLLLMLLPAAPVMAGGGDKPDVVQPNPDAAELATPAEKAAPAPAPQRQPASVDATLMELSKLSAATALAQGRLGLASVENQIQQIGAAPGGAGGLPMNMRPQGDGVPILVGMVSSPKGRRAEFIADGALLQVTEGDWISPQWKLRKFVPNGAEIASRKGQTRVVLFGGDEGRGQP